MRDETFLLNNSVGISHTYSSEFSIDRSTSETAFWCETAPSYFFFMFSTTSNLSPLGNDFSVRAHVCVCVCVRERERERECVYVCLSVRGCVWERQRECVYEFQCAWWGERVYFCFCVFENACVCVCEYGCVWERDIYIECVCVRERERERVCVCVCVCVRVC